MNWHIAIWQKLTSSIVKLFRNAEVKKDIIDLQEKKIAMLTDDNLDLRAKNDILTRKLEVSESKVAALEKELDHAKPKRDLADDTIRVLKLLFKNKGGLTVSHIECELRLADGMAEYHRGVLMDLGMIEWVSVAMTSAWMDIDRPATIGISHEGRAYLVKNKLV